MCKSDYTSIQLIYFLGIFSHGNFVYPVCDTVTEAKRHIIFFLYMQCFNYMIKNNIIEHGMGKII